MKNKQQIESFDDIVFKNRNKEYGAYYLRKRYYRSLLPGAIATILVPLLLFIYQSISLMHQNDELNELTKVDNDQIYAQLDEYAYALLKESTLPKSESLKIKAPDPDQNLVPEIVDSVTEEFELEPLKNLPQNLDMDADTGSVSGFGTENGDENGVQFMYYEVDSLPQFPGGDMALRLFLIKNIKYPDKAIKDNICGVVYITFCIRSDGSIDRIQLQKSVNPLLDNEAIRVVRIMPRWKPGKIRSRNVSVWFSLPINFNLGSKPS